MVNTRTKLKVRWHILDSVTQLLRSENVVFIALCLLMSEFSFNHVGKRVGYLGFAGEDSPDKSCALNINCINRAEVSCIEAVVNKRLDIELKVEPDTLKYHTTRDSSMHRLPWDVVFCVCILRATVKDQPLLLLHLVRKDDFYVKLLLVQHFDLKTEIRLQEIQFVLSAVFGKLKFWAHVGHVNVAFHAAVVCFLYGPTDQPLLDGILI